MLADRRSNCDTDFFELVSISSSEELDAKDVADVLQEALKKAASHPNFDFEFCTLKHYIKKNADSRIKSQTAAAHPAAELAGHAKRRRMKTETVS